jgi:hypothetical protein
MKYSISDARARLAELADYVMAMPGRKVLIEHRNRKERLVLTTEAYIDYLEDKVLQALQDSSRPFKLFGTVESVLSDDELEAALEVDAAEQEQLRKLKFDELFGK